MWCTGPSRHFELTSEVLNNSVNIIKYTIECCYTVINIKQCLKRDDTSNVKKKII